MSTAWAASCTSVWPGCSRLGTWQRTARASTSCTRCVCRWPDGSGTRVVCCVQTLQPLPGVAISDGMPPTSTPDAQRYTMGLVFDPLRPCGKQGAIQSMYDALLNTHMYRCPQVTFWTVWKGVLRMLLMLADHCGCCHQQGAPAAALRHPTPHGVPHPALLVGEPRWSSTSHRAAG